MASCTHLYAETEKILEEAVYGSIHAAVVKDVNAYSTSLRKNRMDDRMRLNFVVRDGSKTSYKTRDIPTGLSASRRNKPQAEAMLAPEIAKYQ